MKVTCDKCYSPIKNGECACGRWYSSTEETPPFAQLLEKCVINFHRMDADVIGGDHEQTGVSFVFFKGGFEMCERVKEYIRAILKE